MAKHLITTDTVGEFADVDDTGASENKVLFRNSSNVLVAKTVVKDYLFGIAGTTTAGDSSAYPTVNLVEDVGNEEYFNFKIPDDFVSLISLVMVYNPTSSQTDADIELRSMYCQIGETYNTHTETDTTITKDWVNNTRNDLDISSVFTSITAGDICGLEVTNLATSANGRIHGIYIKYNASQGL